MASTAPFVVIVTRGHAGDEAILRRAVGTLGMAVKITPVPSVAAIDPEGFRPGRILVRFPPLLFLFPHLWIVMARMTRAGKTGRAIALLPWLFAGEVARIRGFLQARREYRKAGSFESPPAARELRA